MLIAEDGVVFAMPQVSTFAGQSSMSLPNASQEPLAVRVAELTGDGIPDIAVSTDGLSALLVFNGNGAGDFTYHSPSLGLGSLPVDIAFGDFSLDGSLDVVCATHDSSAGIGVATGSGTGTFTEVPGTPLLGLGPANSISISDYSGDGLVDLAVACETTGIHLFVNQGAMPHFSPLPTLSFVAGYRPSELVSADFDLDGDLDIGVANYGGGSLSIPGFVTTHLNNGAGFFPPGPSATYSVGLAPRGLATGDLNGDSLPDLATANELSSSVSLLLGTPSGAFNSSGAGPIRAGGPKSVFINIADMDGDLASDLVVSIQGPPSYLAIHLGDGTGSFSSPALTSVQADAYRIAVGDIRMDGRSDCVVGNNGASTLTLLFGDASSGSLYGSAFGHSTPSCGNVNAHFLSTPAVVGHAVGFISTNAPSSSPNPPLGLLLIGNRASPSGANPFGIGIPVYVDLGTSTDVHALDIFSQWAGYAAVHVVIPNIPTLSGNSYYSQVVWAWPYCGASWNFPFGLSASNGIQLTIQ
ncbi:MAG: VCBS repeat-containing protein [Planctomycetes bacterium]|nr:VCBS repeat-containing protein [Planctomycetota bacterium]